MASETKEKTKHIEDEIAELFRKARARYDAMTPEERGAHDKAQRESWVRANKRTGDPRWD